MPASKRSSADRKPRAQRAAKARGPRPATPATVQACSMCGRSRPCPPGGVPLGWTVSFERKRTEYLCVDCSRANIRAIEGRLTAEYWE